MASASVATRTITVASAPANDEDLANLLPRNAVTTDSVLAKPTVTARSDRQVDVTVKVLRIVMEQFFNMPART